MLPGVSLRDNRFAVGELVRSAPRQHRTRRLTLLITVGIPFVNNADTLLDAIRSVFAQTYQDWELILIDDGSTDRSLQIAKMAHDPRVRVYSDGENVGLAGRLNQIARLAGGEYLARMDADDIMHPERLARQVEMLESNPAVDVVGAATYTVDAGNNVTGIRSTGPLDPSPTAVLTKRLFVHPSVTGRTRWFLDNPYDASFLGSEDQELWCRTCERSTFAKLAQPLLFYRENSRPPGAYLRHYLRAENYDRKRFGIYGPRLIGRRRTIDLMLRSHLKCAVYCAATALCLQRRIVRQRNSPLGEKELLTACQVLDSVLTMHMPGLEGVWV
ncbi:MAG: glycosyltransferase family 2 protein [Armatimonadetes bacterium]|nr:glycosyltransferase family 2 protein [Armatimonadota bacterium]